MRYKLKVYTIYDIGHRDIQEDSIFPSHEKHSDDDRLFILCDGMGGHDSGEVASKAVCNAMSEYINSHVETTVKSFTDDDFNESLNYAYTCLDEKDTGAEKKMGTTLAFLKFHDNGVTIAHIGDSRVYHLRPGKNKENTKILYVSRDHSLVNDLVLVGEITPEEAKHSKLKNIITRAMQPNMETKSKADIFHTKDIISGDYFYLCSDGMLETMDDVEIKSIFSNEISCDSDKVRTLINLTNDNKDNHSAIIIHVLAVDNQNRDTNDTVINNNMAHTASSELLEPVIRKIKKNQHLTRISKSIVNCYNSVNSSYWTIILFVMVLLSILLIIVSINVIFK